MGWWIVARGGIWRRQSGQIGMSGAADNEQVVLSQGGNVDGFTLVRAIGNVTVEVIPNEFTGRQQVWLGLCANPRTDLNPQNPENITGPKWLWWDYFAMSPQMVFGPASADHRFGSAYMYRSFNVRGFRILNPASENDVYRFYATFGSTPDPPAQVNVFWGISTFFLGPP